MPNIMGTFIVPGMASEGIHEMDVTDDVMRMAPLLVDDCIQRAIAP
jgi:hypothetical protein